MFFRKKPKAIPSEKLAVVRQRVRQCLEEINSDPFMDDDTKRAAWNQVNQTYLDGLSKWFRSLWD